MWGQLDSSIDFLNENVKKAGFEVEKEDMSEFYKDPPPPVHHLTAMEQQKEAAEKLKLFSELVAAEAEASEPIVKKEKPKEKPLRFKYYNNDDETDVLTDIQQDSILGTASKLITKNKPKMMYDSSEPEQVPSSSYVDYKKATLDVEKLMEPLHLQTAEQV